MNTCWKNTLRPDTFPSCLNSPGLHIKGAIHYTACHLISAALGNIPKTLGVATVGFTYIGKGKYESALIGELATPYWRGGKYVMKETNRRNTDPY